MPVNDNLGMRMKEFYEAIPKIKLMRRTPVICRIDGRAFHTFTKGFVKPFDSILMESMQETAKYLCENIQGAVFAYTQSDEISVLLVDYATLDSSAFFDYEVQKMCSIISAMATLRFNMVFAEKVENCVHLFQVEETYNDKYFIKGSRFVDKYFLEYDHDIRLHYTMTLEKAVKHGAMFDCRVFNIPKEEVVNYFYWRQLDATRNSIQMVGHYYFTDSELHKKTCNMIQDMLFEKEGINWNDFPTTKKRGSCVIKKESVEDDVVSRNWVIDNNIPIFKNKGREYIDKCFLFDE